MKLGSQIALHLFPRVVDLVGQIFGKLKLVATFTASNNGLKECLRRRHEI